MGLFLGHPRPFAHRAAAIAVKLRGLAHFPHGQLGYLQIPAVDVEVSARFYERLFGWRVSPPEPGFEAPGLIGQWVTDRPAAPAGGPVAWIHVGDIGRALEEAERAGARELEGPFPDGPRQLAWLTDPAGNRIGIVQAGPAPAAAAAGPVAEGSVAEGAAAGEAAVGSGTHISAMLIVPDADAAIAWYREALGARVVWDVSGVAGLEIAGAPFFLHQVNPENPAEDAPARVGMTSVRIELFVDDPDAVVERALAAGATAGSPVEDHQAPWGDHRQGGFHDPFGHNWSVGDRSPLRG